MMPTACDDIDDIEDLVAPGDLKPSDRYNNKKDVSVRSRKNISNGIEENGKAHENGDKQCQSVSVTNSSTDKVDQMAFVYFR